MHVYVRACKREGGGGNADDNTAKRTVADACSLDARERLSLCEKLDKLVGVLGVVHICLKLLQLRLDLVVHNRLDLVAVDLVDLLHG